MPLATKVRRNKFDLFDHLVGARLDRLRNAQPNRLCRFEINDQFVFSRRLHGQVRRLLTLEDAIDIFGGARKILDRIWSVGGEAPSRK